MRQTKASVTKAVRHPVCSMSIVVTGERTTPPTPEPDNAIETASPRLSVNQFAMTTLASRRVPATTTMPARMQSA